MAENKTEKSWQARISESTDAIAQSFVESMSYDWRLYKVDVAGSIAHATMLAKVGLITDADRDAIVKGLKEIETEIDRDGPKWAGFKPELEDIHMCVESALTERIGEPGRKLRARSTSRVMREPARPAAFSATSFCSRASQTMANMSPPMPVMCGSVTLRTAAAATAASMALPPWRSTSSPAAEARGWLVATIPDGA